jgi:hypothetical protein
VFLLLLFIVFYTNGQKRRQKKNDQETRYHLIFLLLISIFNLFSARERIDMSVDPFTGRNPSYCFVELKTKEQAEAAMQELDGREVLGRPVKIKPGVPKARGSQAYGKGVTARPDKDPPRYAFDRWKRADAAEISAELSTGYAEGRRLFVGGLPRASNQLLVNQKIMELFEGYTLLVWSLLCLQDYRAPFLSSLTFVFHPAKAMLLAKSFPQLVLNAQE